MRRPSQYGLAGHAKIANASAHEAGIVQGARLPRPRRIVQKKITIKAVMTFLAF
jgi:hypothetical protein